jgi:hypothetical protein
VVHRIALGGARGAGKYATVDDADRELVQGYSWHLHSNGYPRAYVRGSSRTGMQLIYLHTLITGEKWVDHEDLDPLNCTRANLRKATGSENQWNRGKPRNARTSRFKGVHLNRGWWRAQIKVGGVVHYLGSSRDEEAAARLYDAGAEKFHGSFAKTNVDLGLLPPLP